MNDLRVLFTGAADTGYRAQLGVEVPFTPLLAEDDYEDLRWYLEDYMDLPDGGAVVRAERVERNLESWGRTLYDALFSAEENRALLDRLLAGPEPRQLTIATRDPELLRLPWELLADDAGSLAQRLSVRRQLEEPEATTPRPAQLPLRILYIVSRPADAGFIDPRLTAQALLDALDPLGASVRVDFCRPPTLERMEEMLREDKQTGDPYDIVHFDGHGTFLPSEQIGGLFFEKPDGDRDFVAADRLGDLLARYTIPLAVLEACRSATVGKTAVFRSVAPRLIQAGVGSVLSMGHAVHVEATRLLLDRFYRELVRGATIGQAMAEARKALRSTPARWIESGPEGRTVQLRDWFLPHLYQRAGDDALVPPDVARQQPVRQPGERRRGPAQRDEPGSFPPPPQFGFRGRALELHELEHLFRTRRGLVLHAMGGMGKTALATEAARWWTRSGLFRDGACFLSFEQFASADRVVQVLGTYLAGQKFEQLHAEEQRRRAIELFQQNAVLMVWDNFESALPQFNDGVHGSPYTDDERFRLAELFHDLTVGPGKGCLLVTCRPGDIGLPGALEYELGGLARADSLWLLASIVRRDDLSLDDPRLSRDKLDPLLNDLADHPLSLELVGPHLRTLTPGEIRADFGKLLAQFQQEAPEERNQSLLASLEFSRRHLSPAAREALPWLGLFRGGVFEAVLLGVRELDPEAWEPIRGELQSVALLRTEGDLQVFGRPFLRFHPTLASAATDPTLVQNPEIRQRFIGVYQAFMRGLDKALRGSQLRDGLEGLSREEANCRTAVHWALADRHFRVAGELGNIFSLFLQRSGRIREIDPWVKRLKDALGKEEFTAKSASYERQHALARFAQGDPEGAVAQLQALIERLRHTAELDSSFQLATTILALGRVLNEAGASARAIPILREAMGHWEALVEKAGGRPWEELLTSPDHAKATAELGNLFVTMGDLANALSGASQHDEALVVAEKVVRIREQMGHKRDAAAGHARTASILMAAGRYDEADARYRLALSAAHLAGDEELKGALFQHQGGLAAERNQPEQARHLYQQALRCFQASGENQGLIQTYNLLGLVDLEAGWLAEARAWYEKSRELALQLKDQAGLGQTAQNIGIVWLGEGEAARVRGDEPAARRHFEEARRSVEESLQISQALGNKPGEAGSRGQLARIHLRLGDLAAAERHAHEARQIHESLGLKEAWLDYNTLSEIAQARGDLAATAEWAKKRDDLIAEFERRAQGMSASAGGEGT